MLVIRHMLFIHIEEVHAIHANEGEGKGYG